MARISNLTKYPYDYNITEKDFVIGTDGDSKKTKNFPVVALAEYVRNLNNDISHDRIISIGEITSENNNIIINVNDIGNVVYINHTFYTKNTPDTFTFTPVTEGVKVILLYALPDEQIFYMLEGVQSIEVVEPTLPSGALFIQRIIVTTDGIEIIPDDAISDNKVIITEVTDFANIGQSQKDFNKNISDKFNEKLDKGEYTGNAQDLKDEIDNKTSDKYNDEFNSIANDIIKFIDINTGENVNYRETTTWYDGTPMTDLKADGGLYIKKGSKYYRRVIDKDGELFLEKDTMAQMRALTPLEILYLKAGVYKGVKLNGYYEKGDTPHSLIYQYTDDVIIDNGGDFIVATNGNFKTEQIKNNPCPDFYGAKKNTIGFDSSNAIQKVYDLYNAIEFNYGTYYISKPIYINKKENSLILGKGRHETTLKANTDFRVVNTGISTDGRFDFENGMIIIRRGTINDLDSITVDPITNCKLYGIKIDGSEVVPVGVEAWVMFSSFKDVEITGTNLDAYVLRRGWNNSFDDFFVYYNIGSGVIFETDCNAINIGKMIISHCGGNGFQINQGHSISIASISAETCTNHGIVIEDKLFPELEIKSGTKSAISAITINSIYLENNCNNINYSNIYIKGNDAVDNISIKGIYINISNGRPIYMSGTLRKTINIDFMGVYSVTNKGYIGYINGTLKGDLGNIVINGMDETLFDFENNFEAKQVVFLKTSKSGIMSFNGINLRENSGNYRANGDLEYNKNLKILSLYVEDSTYASNPYFINSYNYFVQTFKGVNFHFFIINKMVHIAVKGSSTEDFAGDMPLTVPNFLSSMANFFGTETLYSDENTQIQTRDYSVLYVSLKQGIELNLKLSYILI